MEDQLKMCVLARLFSPSIGGTKVRTKKQARHLEVLAQCVVMVTGGFSKSESLKEGAAALVRKALAGQ